MGKLVVKPGFVYFLKLVDPQKEFEFTHYKIGETKDIPERIRSLQTGNPFRIVEEKSIESEACNMLEHYLHGKYSPQRVGIEWFKFSDKEFKKVYSSALSFNKEITNIAKEALEFEESVSNGKNIPPTAEMSKLHEELISLYDEVMTLEKKIDIIKIKLGNLTAYSSGIDGITKVITTKPNPRFDYGLFSKNHSNMCSKIIEKYREQIESEMKREAEIRKLRQEGQLFEEILDEEELAKLELVPKGFKIIGKNRITKYPELNNAFKEIEKTKIKVDPEEVKEEKADRSTESLELHYQYLSYNTEISVIGGKIDIIELKLIHACSDNSGIEGICEHERSMEMKKSHIRAVVPKREEEPDDYEVTIYDIDEEKIKSAYPKEYESCLVIPKSQRRFSVLDYRAYID